MNQAYQLPFQSVGQDVTIWPLAKIIGAEGITIGDSVIVDDYVLIMAGMATRIGSFCHISAFTSIVGGGEFEMGDFAGISGHVAIYTGTDDYRGETMTNAACPYPYRIPTRSFVRIGKHVAVGTHSVILPGVTIGEGAAIGANSLVIKDCEPWTIYYGSPAQARRVRPRNQILALEERLRRELYDSAGGYIPKERRA